MKKCRMVLLAVVTVMIVAGCGKKFDTGPYIGEWNTDRGGYFVFNKDQTFSWYQDDTKDENYVMSGVWQVGEIENMAGDKAPKLILDRDYMAGDGMVIDMSDFSDDERIVEILIVESTKNNIHMFNLNTFVEYRAERVK